jgi:hypothetical protein
MSSTVRSRCTNGPASPSHRGATAPFVVNCATKCQAKDISNYRFAVMKSTSAGGSGPSRGDLRQKAASAAKLR